MVEQELSIWKLKREKLLMNYSYMILIKTDGWIQYYTGTMKLYPHMH